MSANFRFDVFLSHNAKDKPRVRRLAERLKRAGLRVWFDEWIVRSGDIIALKVDEGLEQSRVLLLCVSQNALASGWVALERGTAVHRDPANDDRRFIPLLLADCELPDTLRRYKYVDFREKRRKRLRSFCKPADPTQQKHRRRFRSGCQQSMNRSGSGLGRSSPWPCWNACSRATKVGSIVSRLARMGNGRRRDRTIKR